MDRLRASTHDCGGFEGPARRAHDGLLHAPGPRLLLRAGRRLHRVRRLPLLGAWAPRTRTASTPCRGRSTPDGHGGGPVLITNSSDSAQWSVSWPTMPERLQAAGISWKIYNPTGRRLPAHERDRHGHLRQHPAVLLAVQGPLLGAVQAGLHRRLSRRLRPRRGHRPAPPGVVDHGRVSGQDEHPPSPPAVGMASPTGCWPRWCRTPRCGRRPSSSSCTTRTTGSSTTSPRRPRRRAPRAST